VRPAVLDPLFCPLSVLPGLGPRFARLAERLTGPYVVDLIWHLPSGMIDRRLVTTVAAAPADQIVTLVLTVEQHQPPPSQGRPYKVQCCDESGTIDLVFFRASANYLERKLPVGGKVVVSGRLERFHGQAQVVHPDQLGSADALAELAGVEPVYPMTAGLPPATLRRAIQAALARAPALPEWQDPAWLARAGWPDWHAAVRAVHDPDGEAAITPTAPARQRLAFDEALANQLALALVRRAQRRPRGRSVTGDGRLTRPVLEALPFALTPCQDQAVREIQTDLAGANRMLRLLQGDVGSGKTVVALLAMLTVIEAGLQAALMVPTELLARQHMDTLARLAEPAGVRLALLTGRDKGRPRRELLAALAEGTADLVVGTHALFQDEVTFRDLGLVVIDEQHRFGVHQRLLLSGKGAADVLVMTATPIPRTLTLTAYGDMDVSRLTTKPPGRRPIDTRTLTLDRLDEVATAVTRKVAAGDRVYWVCPLVAESETLDLAAATERHAWLTERLGACVGLVHGKMKGPDKDAVMARFATGEITVLVATTVIEVGVHVDAATVMVIEHAERFGLAQLHQLRGRVGRSDRPSVCLLLYEGPLGEAARARLRILRDTEDGFLIAEEDLKLRGAGDLLGTRQSGLPGFKLVDFEAHADLLAVARDDARLMIERDPELRSPRGEALRVLLYLFERDAAVRYLRSG